MFDTVDCLQQNTIDVREGAKAICVFSVWPGHEFGTPPRQEDDKGRYADWPSELDLRRFTGGAELGPPAHDLTSEGMYFNTIIFPVVVCVLVE